MLTGLADGTLIVMIDLLESGTSLVRVTEATSVLSSLSTVLKGLSGPSHRAAEAACHPATPACRHLCPAHTALHDQEAGSIRGCTSQTEMATAAAGPASDLRRKGLPAKTQSLHPSLRDSQACRCHPEISHPSEPCCFFSSFCPGILKSPGDTIKPQGRPWVPQSASPAGPTRKMGE